MLEDLLAANRAWAKARRSPDPGFFDRLAQGQRPRFLWIGCSDSRVPAGELVGLGPGELFVHRNIANLARAEDPSLAAVLAFAVRELPVEHVLVVGHSGCGGVAAAAGLAAGPLGSWLDPIRATFESHRAELEAITDEKTRLERLAELNVIGQVGALASHPILTEAWASGRRLAVHGWIYRLEIGLLDDLHISRTGPPPTAPL
ncbi:MAG: carbonic anhydrase [Caulobacteraceae bacterium]